MRGLKVMTVKWSSSHVLLVTESVVLCTVSQYHSEL